MKKFKQLLTAIAIGAAVAASACWFGDNDVSGLEDDYLAYVSGDVKHIEKTEQGGKITNDQVVAMPFTVFVKISPHHRKDGGSSGSNGNGNPIQKAILQYKIVGKTDEVSADAKSEWITVKEIDNPDWDMSFDEPVALFGRDCIDIPNVTEQTTIIIRLYLSDGQYVTGQLESEPDDFNDIQESVTFTQTGNDNNNHFKYTNGWSAPFVWRLKVQPNVGKDGEESTTTKPSRRPHR